MLSIPRRPLAPNALAAVLLCMVVSGCALTPLADGDEPDSSTIAPATESAAAPTSPGSEQDPAPDGETGEAGEEADPIVFTWSLPPDPESPSVNDDSAYEALFRDDCDSAESLIPRATDESPNFGAWTGPRAIVFTAAGVALCRGDVATGRALTTQAIDDYGIEALGPADMLWCKLYRALRSVVEQRPATAFECRGDVSDGQPPFRTGIDASGSLVFDDPLTPEDETASPSESAAPIESDIPAESDTPTGAPVDPVPTPTGTPQATEAPPDDGS